MPTEILNRNRRGEACLAQENFGLRETLIQAPAAVPLGEAGLAPTIGEADDR